MNLKNATREDIEYILQIAQDVVSLNTPVSIDGMDLGDELGSLVVDPSPGPDEICIEKEKGENLKRYMRQCLDEREITILRMRYGFEGTCYTLNEIAKKLNLTRERIRQIEKRAMQKLRVLFRKKHLTMEDI